jgi:molybdenum cofactor synthesis domain-containing protein
MSSSTASHFTAAILTVSDSVASGTRQDGSGPALTSLLMQNLFQVVATEVVPDERPQIEAAIRRMASQASLVVTTGGTGLGPRDVTPEATRAVCDRLVEGLADVMRFEGMKKTPYAVLSRAVCGALGSALILNVPGSPRGAVESLASIMELLPHALSLLRGHTEH